MGEKPAGRMLVIAGLLLASLFVGAAYAETGDLRLEINYETPPNQPWFDLDNPLIITPSFVNDGGDVAVDNDPSCDVVLNVYNNTGIQLVDGSEACLEKSRAIDLFSGETHTFDALTWSMKDAEGNWLDSGTYTVEAYHSATGLTQSISALIQTPVVLPAEVEYSVQVAHRSDAQSGPAVYQISALNPTTAKVTLAELPPCFLEIQIGQSSELGPACFAGVVDLLPGEMLQVSHILVHEAVNTSLRVSSPGDDFVYATEVEGQPFAPAPLDATLALEVGDRDLLIYGPGETFVSELVLESTASTPQRLDFTSSCKAEYWVLNDFGEVVYDSREMKPCQAIDLELELADEERFTLSQWAFDQSNACLVAPGVYTVVAELPEYGLSDSTTVRFADISDNPCSTNVGLNIDSTLTWTGDDRLEVEVALDNTGQERYIRMVSPCPFEADFIDQDLISIHRSLVLCGDYDGRKILVPTGERVVEFETISIEMTQGDQAILPDGEYTLDLHLTSSPRITTSFDFTWSAAEQDITEENEIEQLIETYQITGQWIGLLTESGTCWMLEDADETYLLANARSLPSWTPQSTMEGLYVVHNEVSAPACQSFNAPSVALVEVQLERNIVTESAEESVQENEVVPAVTEDEPALIVPAVSAIVTVSLLSMLVAVAATNESLRIPSTLAGLWFLGLIGKTHETTDGRYQRGRLMGYLTANPGCHFRALMSALEMSNGQITHHLRILEAEENIWRKKDGRLVRYYPLTNQLHPNTSEDDLPVPSLSPDPNSLQGKILGLLDRDGDLGQFPTQAELAKRLKKSQQLISHHLRTLQKYGLVERRKMGVKNRYKLTREAIFLLETSEDFPRD